MTWYWTFWTSPKGDGYVILAHQYMAAVLNQLNGADTSEVDDALARAAEILENGEPGSLRGPAGREAKELAGLLDDFNNGLVGPGHCSDAPPDGD